jgi:hypothetical protein
MKGSPISPRPAAKAAHPHPAGAGAIRSRRDVLAGLLSKAITKRQSGVGSTFYLLSADYIERFLCTFYYPFPYVLPYKHTIDEGIYLFFS